MTTKEWLKRAGIVVGLILIGIFIDRQFLIKEKIVELPTTINIPELKNAWLTEVKKSYISKDSVDKLLAKLRYSPWGGLRVGTYSSVPDSPKAIAIRPESDTPVYSTSLDTHLIAQISVIQDEDTTRQALPLNTHFSLQFIGGEYEIFNLETFAISPFTIHVKTKERLVDDTNTIGVWLSGSTRYSLGAHLQFGGWMGGYEHNLPLNLGQVKLQYRIIGF